ncbi:unnamed protein product [Rhizophagus irregularis]|nr:unnamed protein product [Rhizophagus irregularis]
MAKCIFKAKIYSILPVEHNPYTLEDPDAEDPKKEAWHLTRSEVPFGNIQLSDSVINLLNNEVGRAVTSGNALSDNANTELLEDKKTD